GPGHHAAVAARAPAPALLHAGERRTVARHGSACRAAGDGKRRREEHRDRHHGIESSLSFPVRPPRPGRSHRKCVWILRMRKETARAIAGGLALVALLAALVAAAVIAGHAIMGPWHGPAYALDYSVALWVRSLRCAVMDALMGFFSGIGEMLPMALITF